MEIIIDGKTYYHAGFGQACDGRCSTVLTLDAGVIGATLSTQEYFDITFEDVKCPRWPPKYVRPSDAVEFDGEVCIHYSR